MYRPPPGQRIVIGEGYFMPNEGDDSYTHHPTGQRYTGEQLRTIQDRRDRARDRSTSRGRSHSRSRSRGRDGSLSLPHYQPPSSLGLGGLIPALSGGLVGSHVDHSKADRRYHDDHYEVDTRYQKPKCWDHGCNGREFSTFSRLLRHQREMQSASSQASASYESDLIGRRASSASRENYNELSLFGEPMLYRRSTSDAEARRRNRSRSTSRTGRRPSLRPTIIYFDSATTLNQARSPPQSGKSEERSYIRTRSTSRSGRDRIASDPIVIVEGRRQTRHYPLPERREDVGRDDLPSDRIISPERIRRWVSSTPPRLYQVPEQKRYSENGPFRSYLEQPKVVPEQNYSSGQASGTSRRTSACKTCRTRKRLCDLGRPRCNNCARGEFECIYDDSARTLSVTPSSIASLEQYGGDVVEQVRIVPDQNSFSGKASSTERRVKACTRCRLRYTICDLSLPRCGPCERAESECVYDVSAGRYGQIVSDDLRDIGFRSVGREFFQTYQIFRLANPSDATLLYSSNVKSPSSIHKTGIHTPLGGRAEDRGIVNTSSSDSIFFYDCLGRRFSFPIRLCATWKAVDTLISQAFTNTLEYQAHVKAGCYDLIGPDDEIILPQAWETMIRPGWTIVMRMWPQFLVVIAKSDECALCLPVFDDPAFSLGQARIPKDEGLPAWLPLTSLPLIQVVPNGSFNRRLGDLARINYSTVYKVSYNVRVQPFGVINPRARQLFDASSPTIVKRKAVGEGMSTTSQSPVSEWATWPSTDGNTKSLQTDERRNANPDYAWVDELYRQPSPPNDTNRDDFANESLSISEPTTTSRDGDPSSSRNQTSRLEFALSQKDQVEVYRLIENEFIDVAVGSWKWLAELPSLGYSKKDIAELVLEQRHEGPWISFEPWIKHSIEPETVFHSSNCVHRDSRSITGTQSLSYTVSAGQAVNIAINAGSSASLSEGPIRPPPRNDATSLGNQNVQENVASLCGLAGIVPRTDLNQSWQRQVRFHDPKVASVSYWNDEYGRTNELAIKHLIMVMEQFCTSAAIMQEQDKCCSGYTVLAMAIDEKAVELKHVPFSTAVKFLERLRSASYGEEVALSICDMLARQTLESLQPVPIKWQPKNRTCMLNTCSLLTQLFCLTFVAYCQAHVGELDLFFLEDKIAELSLLGFTPSLSAKGQIVARLVRLSCMGKMVKSPVLVLCSPNAKRRPSYDIRGSAVDLIDLWGPGTLVTDKSYLDKIYAILIGGGAIYQTSTRNYHWSKKVPPIETLIRKNYGGYLGVNTIIEIGAQLTVNALCLSTEQTCLTKLGSLRDVLGSRDPRWEMQQRQLGLQGGQYVNMTFQASWNKIPGRTLKACLMDRLQTDLHDLSFLESPWGLQVSFCSGLARRVLVRHLLADLLPAFMQRRVPRLAAGDTLLTRYNLIEELRDGDLYTLFNTIYRTSSECYSALRFLIQNIMEALQDTGVEPDGQHFIVALVSSRPALPLQCVKFSTQEANFWTRALQDSAVCATFAYFTADCLQVEGHGCRNAESSWTSELVLLETEVRCHLDNPRPSMSSVVTLEDGQSFPIRQQHSNTQLQLWAEVIRPNMRADPRLLIRPLKIPPHFWKRISRRNARQIQLQERSDPYDDVHRAFMTSKRITAHSFA